MPTSKSNSALPLSCHLTVAFDRQSCNVSPFLFVDIASPWRFISSYPLSSLSSPWHRCTAAVSRVWRASSSPHCSSVSLSVGPTNFPIVLFYMTWEVGRQCSYRNLSFPHITRTNTKFINMTKEMFKGIRHISLWSRKILDFHLFLHSACKTCL